MKVCGGPARRRLSAWVLLAALGRGTTVQAAEPVPAERRAVEPSAAAPLVAPSSPMTPAPVPPRQLRPAAPVPASERIRVAVGLSPDTVGSKLERGLIDRLERGVRASVAPPADLRRLRTQAVEARTMCREGAEDLVILVGYVPDRADPVLLSRDCRLDVELGIRQAAAVDEPGLLGALWDEHLRLVQAGARERRPLLRMGSKAKAITIGVAAAVIVGLAVGLVLSSTLREDRVVIRVSP